jgi:pimeloyl-ACP methyl ester carboxylesterase
MNDQSISLRRMGSFFVGGEQKAFSGHEPRDYILAKDGVPVQINLSGTCHVGQMYVQYCEPDADNNRVPMLLWHGGSMTGACWESTPDGRPGWQPWFLRNGWTTMTSDAVERGRSGWAPLDPGFTEAPFLRTLDDILYQFRIAPKGNPDLLHGGAARLFEGSQFPLEAMGQFLMQFVPRWSGTDALVLSAYIALLKKVGPAVVVAHSQGGAFAFHAAQAHPELVKALVVIEPSQGGLLEDAAQLASVPVIAVYGDYYCYDKRSQSVREKVEQFLAAIEQSGGDVDIIDLPKLGITGNSHLLMMEKNSSEIAALIQQRLVEKGFA